MKMINAEGWVIKKVKSWRFEDFGNGLIYGRGPVFLQSLVLQFFFFLLDSNVIKKQENTLNNLPYKQTRYRGRLCLLKQRYWLEYSPVIVIWPWPFDLWLSSWMECSSLTWGMIVTDSGSEETASGASHISFNLFKNRANSILVTFLFCGRIGFVRIWGRSRELKGLGMPRSWEGLGKNCWIVVFNENFR